MVRRIYIALIALCMMIGIASAEEFIAADGDALYVAASNLLRVAGNRVEILSDAQVRDLQIADGWLYYVAYAEDESGATLQPFRTPLDAFQPTPLADAMPIGTDYEYDGSYSQLLTYTTYYGFRDMRVYGDYIYYIGDDFAAGGYNTECIDWNGADGRSSYRADYESCAALYRMDPDGQNPTMLIGDLGNGENVHMAIADDRIIICTCWQNAVYAYDFANLLRYDLNGTLISAAENPSEGLRGTFYKKDQAYTAIINAIYPLGDKIYASFGDSEGDFASSRLVDAENCDITIGYEALYAGSDVSDRGIAYITSDIQATYWDDRIVQTLALRLIDADGDRAIARIPPEFASYSMRVNLMDDAAYVLLEDNLLRVPLDGGVPQMLYADGFADCAEFSIKA